MPVDQKKGVTIGMAMTEKQGGSDVRANTTRAVPVGAGGPGGEYELVGHKFFVCPAMCDAFSFWRRAGGLSCFLVPRWKPDGTQEPAGAAVEEEDGQRFQRLERDGSCAALRLDGRQGRTRRRDHHRNGGDDAFRLHDRFVLDHAFGAVQAVDHCRQRAAFGKLLIDQPIMQNVLADLALETKPPSR